MPLAGKGAMEKQICPIPGLILIYQLVTRMVIIQQWDVYPSAEVQPSPGVQHFRNSLDDLAGADPYQGSPEGTREGRPRARSTVDWHASAPTAGDAAHGVPIAEAMGLRCFLCSEQN